MVRARFRKSPSRLVAGILRSRTWLSCRMSPPRSGPNCPMNMCWAAGLRRGPRRKIPAGADPAGEDRRITAPQSDVLDGILCSYTVEF